MLYDMLILQVIILESRRSDFISDRKKRSTIVSADAHSAMCEKRFTRLTWEKNSAELPSWPFTYMFQVQGDVFIYLCYKC